MSTKLKFHLIPCSQHKTPLTPHGEKDASDRPKQWSDWAKQYGRCNWAVATGPSGLIVVDEDAYKPSYTEGELEHRCGLKELPKTVEWRSARGGRCRMFRRPAGVEVPPRSGVVPAVDVKASAGYVLIPPSKNSEGQPYEWVNPPSTTEVAEAPPELVKFLVEHRPSSAARPRRKRGDAGELYLKAGDGRWEFLRRLGGILRREGCGGSVLTAALHAFALDQCEPDPTIRRSEVDRLVDWLLTLPVGMDAQLEGGGRGPDKVGTSVAVVWPDGTRMNVSSTDLQDALSEGAAVVINEGEEE